MAAKTLHDKAQAELEDSLAEIQRRNSDVETQVGRLLSVWCLSTLGLVLPGVHALHCGAEDVGARSAQGRRPTGRNARKRRTLALCFAGWVWFRVVRQKLGGCGGLQVQDSFQACACHVAHRHGYACVLMMLLLVAASVDGGRLAV